MMLNGGFALILINKKAILESKALNKIADYICKAYNSTVSNDSVLKENEKALDNEVQRKRLIDRFVKKVIVYNDKIDIYLIAASDTNEICDDVKDEVSLNSHNFEKYMLGMVA